MDRSIQTSFLTICRSGFVPEKILGICRKCFRKLPANVPGNVQLVFKTFTNMSRKCPLRSSLQTNCSFWGKGICLGQFESAVRPFFLLMFNIQFQVWSLESGSFFPEISPKFPGNFLKTSRNLPGFFPDFPRIFLGNLLKISWKFP